MSLVAEAPHNVPPLPLRQIRHNAIIDGLEVLQEPHILLHLPLQLLALLEPRPEGPLILILEHQREAPHKLHRPILHDPHHILTGAEVVGEDLHGAPHVPLVLGVEGALGMVLGVVAVLLDQLHGVLFVPEVVPLEGLIGAHAE